MHLHSETECNVTYLKAHIKPLKKILPLFATLSRTNAGRSYDISALRPYLSREDIERTPSIAVD